MDKGKRAGADGLLRRQAQWAPGLCFVPDNGTDGNVIDKDGLCWCPGYGQGRVLPAFPG